MRTVTSQVKNEIVINKSRFITILYKVNNKETVVKILDNLKKEYENATHYCYAYIINETKKSSDDGEPGGTAGIPILQVLEKNELNDVLCVVIRYFGGIKLGAGGLVRAYTKSVTEALKKVQMKELIPGYKIEIITNYEEQKKLDYLLKGESYEKIYHNEVIYHIHISKTNLIKLQNYQYQIIEEILIEQ